MYFNAFINYDPGLILIGMYIRVQDSSTVSFKNYLNIHSIFIKEYSVQERQLLERGTYRPNSYRKYPHFRMAGTQ